MSRMILLEPLSESLNSDCFHGRGNVITMFGQAHELRSPSALNTDAFLDAVIGKLEDCAYNPERDIFVVAGRTNKIAIALAAIRGHYSGDIRIAVYDGTNGKYVNRTI